LSNGRTLTAICGDPGMPPRRTVEQWTKDDRNGFGARFRDVRKTAGPKGGGPSVYAPDLAEKILEGLMEGRSLADVCRDPGIPRSSTVRNWADEDRDGLAVRYARARQIGYATMMDELLEIADDRSGDVLTRQRADGSTERIPNPGNITRARVRLNARMWLISKSLPRNRDGGLNLLERIEARDTLAELMKEIERRNREAAEAEGIAQKGDSP
jgi:hypothetical protein